MGVIILGVAAAWYRKKAVHFSGSRVNRSADNLAIVIDRRTKQQMQFTGASNHRVQVGHLPVSPDKCAGSTVGRYGDSGDFIKVVDARRSAVQQMLGGELAHLSRADQQNALAFERPEDFPGQFDRRVTDGDGRGSDARLGANLLGDGERAREDLFEPSAQSAARPRDGVSGFDLPQDLGLANHH